MHAKTNALRATLRETAKSGMQSVMQLAEQTARRLAEWNEPGEWSQMYGATHWRWTTTGLSRASISAYLLTDPHQHTYSPQWTVSYRNDSPRQHHHYSVRRPIPPSKGRNTITGIITMTAHNAPYLQKWEQTPVTVQVLEDNWGPVYIPMLRALLESTLS